MPTNDTITPTKGNPLFKITPRKTRGFLFKSSTKLIFLN